MFGASRECAAAGGVPASADADPGENKDDPPARGEPSSLAAALLSFWCQLGVRPPLPGGVLGPLSSLRAGEPTTSPRARRSTATHLSLAAASTPRATSTKKPVLWSSGELDLFGGFSDPATAAKLEQELADAGNKDYTVKVYKGEIGHGFMNESPEPYANETAKDEGFEAIGFDKTFYPYDADVANAAWGSLFDFFGKYL